VAGLAVTNGFCTLAELRTQLDDTTSALSTELLERAINTSSQAIREYCGRKFWLDASVTARYYTTDLTGLAWVDDIGTTTGLLVDTDTSSDGSWATSWTINTDFVLHPRNAAAAANTAYAYTRIKAIGTKAFMTSTLRDTLRVTAKFGWSEVPVDITEACLLKASSLFERRKSPLGMASGISEFGVVRISRSDPDVIALLQPYIRVGVGAV